MAVQLTLAAERWAEFWPEAQPLMLAHHLELADEGTRRGAFNIDYVKASQLDLMNILVIVSARDAGELVGYCLWYIGSDLECAGTMTGSQGPWYVKPSHRKGTLGLNLFKASVAILKSQGIVQLFPHHWERGGGARLGSFFKRLGAVPLETVYSLWIGD